MFISMETGSLEYLTQPVSTMNKYQINVPNWDVKLKGKGGWTQWDHSC